MFDYGDDDDSKDSLEDMFKEDIDVEREFKTVEEYVDEYEDGV